MLSAQHVNGASRVQTVVLLIVGLLTYFRLQDVGTSFSYDYAAYLYYFEAIRETSWSEFREALASTFPYVTLRTYSLVEFGFFILAKLLLQFVEPADAYAVIAAVSVVLRTYVMRAFRVTWAMIFVVQVFAITLLEANAIRAGLSLSLCLLGLLLHSRGRFKLSVLVFACSLATHLQALLFLIPYFAMTVLPSRWYSARGVPHLLLASCILAGLGSAWTIERAAFYKLDAYQGIQSGSAGLNVLSILTLAYTGLVCNFLLSRKARTGSEVIAGCREFWIRVSLSCVPSILLFAAGTSTGSVGTRAWQFAVIVLVCVPTGRFLQRRRLKMSLALLAYLLFIAADTNVLFRYPLSNFFAPPVPATLITPRWDLQ